MNYKALARWTEKYSGIDPFTTRFQCALWILPEHHFAVLVSYCKLNGGISIWMSETCFIPASNHQRQARASAKITHVFLIPFCHFHTLESCKSRTGQLAFCFSRPKEDHVGGKNSQQLIGAGNVDFKSAASHRKGRHHNDTLVLSDGLPIGEWTPTTFRRKLGATIMQATGYSDVN